MHIPFRIALRYIFTFRSFHFITFITFISTIGIIVGVAALICVMSIFNGFRVFTENQLIVLDPHIRISAKEGAWLKNADSLIHKIKHQKKVLSAFPIIQERIILFKETNMQVALINTISSNDTSLANILKNKIIFGKFELTDNENSKKVVLGAGLADKLRIFPGDTIKILTPAMIESTVRTMKSNTGIEVVVEGVIQSNIKDYDDRYIFTNENFGYLLFKIDKGTASGIDIKLYSANESDQVKNDLMKTDIKNIDISTWYDLHSELYNIMKFERIAAFVVLSLIVIIAVFNIFASLIMTVVEKKPDIAILKSIGATDKQIKKIFLWEGLLIGVSSGLIGTLLGLSLCFGQLKYGWFKLDTSKYLLDAIPIYIDFYDVFFVFLLTFILSVVATIYPAGRAAKTSIVEAIRTE